MASEDCNNFYVFIDDIRIGSPASCSSSYTSARTTSGGGSLEMPELTEPAQPAESLKLERESLADKMKVNFNVAVYPNPSADEFELRLSSMSQNKASIRVIDALGRVVKTMMLASNQTVRFGSELRRGNYMVEVVQGEKKEIIKLVKL
ncbi:MAG: T9SS type A sorting domain-containing protein [Chitinophagaceae bacterium]|nr:MAG: T9SS type A sorting domain-containing protein [Chitinophagaceae bacterium]